MPQEAHPWVWLLLPCSAKATGEAARSGGVTSPRCATPYVPNPAFEPGAPLSADVRHSCRRPRLRTVVRSLYRYRKERERPSFWGRLCSEGAGSRRRLHHQAFNRGQVTVKGFSLLPRLNLPPFCFSNARIKITDSRVKRLRYRFAFLSHTTYQGLLSQLLKSSNFKGHSKKLNSLMSLRNSKSYSERETATGSGTAPARSQGHSVPLNPLLRHEQADPRSGEEEERASGSGIGSRRDI